MRRRSLFLLLAAAGLALAACSEGPSSESLPDVKLPTLGPGRGPSLASCPTPKCLTIYLAPWCGYCRAATPMILSLRKFLGERRITTRIVIGKDRTSSLKAYAKVFGPDTLLDAGGELEVGGVPHFIVSDAAGKVLRDVAGVPLEAKDAADFASFYGLP